MLRKQSENNKSVDTFLVHTSKKDYRKELNDRNPELKQERVVEKDRSWAAPKMAQNAYGDTLARNASSIRSSRCAIDGGITNNGGPTKQVGVENKNTIWDSNSLEKIANTLSTQETTKIEKESSDRIRMKKQAEYKQSIMPKVGEEDVIMQKTANVSSAAAKASGKGWVPTNKISMFDKTDNFERLDALQDRVNPKVSEEKVKTAKVHGSKIVKTSKEASHNFVDAIIDQDKKTVYKSVHNDAVDRLFNALNKKQKDN